MEGRRSSRRAKPGFCGGLAWFGQEDRAVQGFPLLIGVVGQQQIAETDVPRIREAVRSVIEEFRASYRHTEIALVTALSTPSEMVAAEAARAAGVPVTVLDETRKQKHWIAVPQLLLLLWDGRDDPACAAAAAVREGLYRESDWRPLEQPDIGPYFQISADVARRFPQRYAGDADSEEDFYKAMSALDRYNRDLSGSDAPPAESSLDQMRLRTDAVANRLQRSTIRWQTALYAIALGAAAIQIVKPSAPLWVKLGSILIALVVYRIARRHDVQNRYQDYRAIAEALRVQIAWWAMAVDEPVERAYLRMQQSELQWIRMLLRVAALLHRPTASSRSAQTESLRDWIDDQRRYFERAANREARRQERVHSLAEILVIANITVSVGLAGLLVVWHGRQNVADELQWICGVLAALGAVFVGLLTSYSRARSFDENAKRYRRMFLLFSEAQRELDAAIGANHERGIHELARSLGREALTEQAEWLLSQRSRPVAIVESGAG